MVGCIMASRNAQVWSPKAVNMLIYMIRGIKIVDGNKIASHLASIKSHNDLEREAEEKAWLRERFKDVLLAVNMEDGAISQRMWESSRSWKK